MASEFCNKVSSHIVLACGAARNQPPPTSTSASALDFSWRSKASGIAFLVIWFTKGKIEIDVRCKKAKEA